jgi:hypothetical protein
VTLTDAGVAALDPTGSLGYQPGDEIVNRSGMTVGCWFGPNGITGERSTRSDEAALVTTPPNGGWPPA